MRVIRWRGEFELGIEEIDRQHRLVVDRLNACALVVGKASFDAGAFQRRIAAAYGEMRHHLTSEERLLASFGYPEVDGHRQRHADFLQELGEAAARYRAQPTVATAEIFHERAVRAWFQHLLTDDRDFVAHLNRLRPPSLTALSA